MANVDTLPEILRPLMEGPSIETPRCAVCGAPWPLNRPAPPGSGHWEYLLLPEPTKYADALAMDGWGRLPRGRRCM